MDEIDRDEAPPDLPRELQAWCTANGWPTGTAQVLVGGAVNTVVRLGDDDGSVVAKCTRDAPVGLFATEADGLRRLAAAATVTVPEVIAVSDEYLVLADLGPTDRGQLDWARLGREVAALHDITALRFGADHDNFLGLLPQRNTWTSDGHEFFAQQRLLRYLDEPLVAGALTAQDRRRLDRIVERLPQLVPAQPASLLHGDLWSGNVIGNASQVAVVDPAVYYGWPEAELSMLYCSSNADQRFFDAYLELHPLEPGWPDRMPLLHLREHFSVLAHFGEQSGELEPIRAVLRRFAD